MASLTPVGVTEGGYGVKSGQRQRSTIFRTFDKTSGIFRERPHGRESDLSSRYGISFRLVQNDKIKCRCLWAYLQPENLHPDPPRSVAAGEPDPWVYPQVFPCYTRRLPLWIHLCSTSPMWGSAIHGVNESPNFNIIISGPRVSVGKNAGVDFAHFVKYQNTFTRRANRCPIRPGMSCPITCRSFA